MRRTSYQEELLDAIRGFLPSGFFRIGPCGVEPSGPRNGSLGLQP
jgi:hypothetical protein